MRDTRCVKIVIERDWKKRGDKRGDKSLGWMVVISVKQIGSLYDLITLGILALIKHASKNFN